MSSLDQKAGAATKHLDLHWAYHPRSQRAVDFLLAGAKEGFPQLKKAAEHLLKTGVIDDKGRALKLWSAGEWVRP